MKISVKNNKEILLYFLYFIPICEPYYITSHYHLRILFKLLLIADIAIFVLKHYIEFKVDKMSMAYILFFSEMIIVTAINSGTLSSLFWDALLVIFTSLVFWSEKDNFKNVVRVLMLIFEFLVYLNLLTLVLLPNGIYTTYVNSWYGDSQMWLLGNANTYIIWLFPALIIAWLYKSYFKSRLRCYLLTAAVIATEIINGSGTGKVGVVIYVFIMIFPLIKKYINLKLVLAVVAVGFCYIVLNRNYGFIEVIVVDVLQKNMTFTNRIYIWDNAVSHILAKPVFGHGVLDSTVMINYLGRFLGVTHGGATHCHCEFLQLLFQGGAISFIIYIYMIFIAVKKESRERSDSEIVCIYGIIVLLIMGIAEVLNYPIFYVLFPLAYACKENRLKFSQEGVCDETK